MLPDIINEFMRGYLATKQPSILFSKCFNRCLEFYPRIILFNRKFDRIRLECRFFNPFQYVFTIHLFLMIEPYQMFPSGFSDILPIAIRQDLSKNPKRI